MSATLLLLALLAASAECWRPMLNRDPLKDPTLEYNPPMTVQHWEDPSPPSRVRYPPAMQPMWTNRSPVHNSPHQSLLQQNLHSSHYANHHSPLHSPHPTVIHFPNQQHFHSPHVALYSTPQQQQQQQQPVLVSSYRPTPVPQLQVVTPGTPTTTTTTTTPRPPPAMVMEGHSKVKKYGPVEGSVNSVFLQSGKFV